MKQKRDTSILVRLAGIIALGVFLVGAVTLSPHGNAYARQFDGTSGCLSINIDALGGDLEGEEVAIDFSSAQQPDTTAKGSYTAINTNTGAKAGSGSWSAPSVTTLPLPPTGQQYEYDFSGTTNGGQCVSGFITIT